MEETLLLATERSWRGSLNKHRLIPLNSFNILIFVMDKGVYSVGKKLA